MKNSIIIFLAIVFSNCLIAQNTYEFRIQFIEASGSIVHSIPPNNSQISYSLNGGPMNSTSFWGINGTVQDTLQTTSTSVGNLILFYEDCFGNNTQSSFTLPVNSLYEDIVVYCDSSNTGLQCNQSIQHSLNSGNLATVNFSSPVELTVGTTFSWDYGDGMTDVTNFYESSHTYSNSGSYNACLTINSPFCTSTTCDSVTLNSSGSCNASFSIDDSASAISVFANNPSNNFTYSWDFGNGITAAGPNAFYDYQATGNFTICLTVTDIFGNCTDDTCMTVSVSNSSCDASFSYSINSHNVVELVGQNAPSNANEKWYFGDGNTKTGTPSLHYSYDNAGSYTISRVIESNNGTCYDSTSQVIQALPGLRNLEVFVINPLTDSTTTTAGTTVYLIKHDSVAGTLTAIDSTVIQTTAQSANFVNLENGEYLVKAAVQPGEFTYSMILPSYYTAFGNAALLWNNADYIELPNVVNQSSIYESYTLIQGTNPGGPGFIGGLISQGANKTEAVGDPVPHLDVLLLDDQMEPILATKTNGQGEFEFDDLALGNYYVYPEYPGKTTTPILVELDGSNQDAFNIDFEANDSGIRPADAVGMNEVVANEFLIFPVPAKDQITIQNNSEQSINSIKIYSINGALLFESNELLLQNTSEQIDLNNWTSGSYLIRFQGNNFTSVKSFIRE